MTKLTIQENEKRYSSVNFKSIKYILTMDAVPSGRLLNNCQNNWQDANDGDEYDFEMTCTAIDEDGNEALVSWIFTGIRGEDDPEYDTYDYSQPEDVILV